MDLIKGTAILYTASSWSDNDDNLAAALNSSSSSSLYYKWGVTFEYNAIDWESQSDWQTVDIPQDDDGWDCTLDGVSNESTNVGVRYNTYVIDDDFSNSYSGYEFKGIALYMDGASAGDFKGETNCWFLAKDGVQYEIGTVPSKGTGIMISPVYVKLTSPDHLLLQYGSPIVVNRYPQAAESSGTGHIIVSERGYDEEYCKNQINFLELVSSVSSETGIYANNEPGSLVVEGESQKVIRVPSNDYLDSVPYGMLVSSNTIEIEEENYKIIHHDSDQTQQIEIDNWYSTGSPKILNLNISIKKDDIGGYTEIGDTPSYKFLGICIIYTATGIQRNFVLNPSDRCFFIARKWKDVETQVEHENDYDFNILCGNTSNSNAIETKGFVYVTPVFEAQREVYLTDPIIVKEFPDFVNEGKSGNNDVDIDKDTNLYNVTDFGHTIGSDDNTIFFTGVGGKYVSEHDTDEFGATFDASAGFVELFGHWLYVENDWKNNMGPSDGAGSDRCLLEFNKTINYNNETDPSEDKYYGETFDNSRKTDLYKVYINTAELDNNSLYLTIRGTCSNLTEKVGRPTEDTTIIDHQAKAGNYEMIGFVVYFKGGANDLSEIENWATPSGHDTYSSYFMPIWWETPSSVGPSSSYSASIKIDFSEITDSIVYENYLAISPVYLKTDTKTITLGCAQDTIGDDISDYVDTYTVSVTTGDTTKQYSLGDSIEVSEGDTITITLASSTDNENYTYSETFTIGEKTYSDGASIGYDDLEDEAEFHPIFSYSEKPGKKTITISDALNENGNVLSGLTADDKYKFSCNDGNEYGYNDTISVQSDDTLKFTCELTNSEVIYDSTTNSYSQYTLERIEIVDTNGELVKYSNDNNPTIEITYEDFGDLDDLYIHPIYSYNEKESTNYKINNDTCREIELSIYSNDTEYNGSDYYINGNLTNSITVKEWSDLEIAIYPSLPNSLSLKISRIKDTNGWSSFKNSSNTDIALDINENGSIYDSIDNEDVINNIDYSADIYMKVGKQNLDVYHMSFLNGKLNFNTSAENNVYVHCWCDKDDLRPDEPIGSYVNNDLDYTAKRNLALRGVLPINYDFYSYSRNKTIKSISTTTTHIINTSNNKCPEDDPFINIALFPNTNESLYYVDKGSHFVDMYEETNPFTNNTNNEEGLKRYPGYSNDDNSWTSNTKEWEYAGNGVYYFIVDLSNFNTSDITAFDYETYACGPLIGYINEREDDNTNAVILKENDFFIGVIEPGTDSVTVYGYDTVDSEQYLMTHNENDDYNGPYIINITDGDILDSIRKINYLGEDQIMPNDYCQYQTGNQYVMFRLRNPYNGKVLNYDDSYSYSALTNAETANDALNGDYLNSTHEQTGFLTLWEQRSLFNALNGKPTYVNEVNEWAQLSETQIESLDNEGKLINTTITIGDTDTDPANYVDAESYWAKYVKSKFSSDNPDLKNNTYFTINTKTRRKAGRALVDNIDDWFSWYKREEQPGVIANGNLDSPGGTPLCFAGPLLNEEYGCCINSDAVRSSTTLGPGESITIPIIVLYKTYEENGRDTASYSLGFDIRNNLYDSPLYYEVKFTAKYHSNVTDAVSSQKASIQESTKYNATVR